MTHAQTSPGPQTDYAFIALGARWPGGTPAGQPDAQWLYTCRITDDYFKSHQGPFRVAIPPAEGWRPRDTFARIVDGTSNQFFVGEKHIPQHKLGECSLATDSDSLMKAHDCSYLGGGTYYNVVAMARATAHWHSNNTASIAQFLLAIGPTYEPLTSWPNGAANGAGFGSYHPGICQFLLGDGSVRAVPVVTPVEGILVPFSDVDDGKVVSLD